MSLSLNDQTMNEKIQGDENEDIDIVLDSTTTKIPNKKIYFDPEGTHVKIGYDEETGVGFVQLIKE